MFNKIKNKYFILRMALYLISAAILLYLILLPFYPLLKYQIYVRTSDGKNTNYSNQDSNEKFNHLPQAGFEFSPDRLIIAKIGVNSPIVESKNEDYGLNHGAWRLPDSSTPDQGGKMILTGHRFKYLPPNNLTFYLLDKLSVGDEIYILWQGKEYFYLVNKISIVPSDDLSILEPESEPSLTIFTCHPIFSMANRLVITAGLKKQEP